MYDRYQTMKEQQVKVRRSPLIQIISVIFIIFALGLFLAPTYYTIQETFLLLTFFILAPGSRILLHFLDLSLKIDSSRNLLQFLHKLLLIILRTCIQINNLFFQASKLLLQIFYHLRIDLALKLILLLIVNFIHESFQIYRQQFQQILFIFLVLTHTELERIFFVLHVVEKSKGVDPFQLLTTFDREFIGSLHKLRICQLQPQHLEQVLTLREDVDLLVIVRDCLVEQIPLSAVIHPLHHFLLTVDYLVRTLLIDVALEVVLVIRLPRLRTHIAEVFTAGAGHEVATHRPLHRLFAPWANLSIARNPFSIRLFRQHLLGPFGLLLAGARVVIVALAPEAENLATNALNSVDIHPVDLDAVSAVDPRAKLIISILHDQQLAYSFHPLLQKGIVASEGQHSLNHFQQQWDSTGNIHAQQEWIA